MNKINNELKKRATNDGPNIESHQPDLQCFMSLFTETLASHPQTKVIYLIAPLCLQCWVWVPASVRNLPTGFSVYFSENLCSLCFKQAFGNARTAENNNSSRFGKFIQLNYLEGGVIRGYSPVPAVWDDLSVCEHFLYDLLIFSGLLQGGCWEVPAGKVQSGVQRQEWEVW